MMTHDREMTWDGLGEVCNPLSRDLVLEMGLRLSMPVRGSVVEFGVAEGHSTRTIERVVRRHDRSGRFGRPTKRIYAFDSFKGLREKFENLEPGSFACEPPQIPGVTIVNGYFEDTLSPELAREVGQVSFAHLDADLYSSTLCALDWLTPLLVTGSLLLFDEYLGENQSEQRAFEDWSGQRDVHTIQIAEFLRPPSGHGSLRDKRVLLQVIGRGTLPPWQGELDAAGQHGILGKLRNRLTRVGAWVTGAR
jgi:hypothetical protein